MADTNTPQDPALADVAGLQFSDSGYLEHSTSIAINFSLSAFKHNREDIAKRTVKAETEVLAHLMEKIIALRQSDARGANIHYTIQVVVEPVTKG
jgi:hypothetical protein